MHSKPTTDHVADLERRLAAARDADPYDTKPDRNSLAMAVIALTGIAETSEDPLARELAGKTLDMLEERAGQTEPVDGDDPPLCEDEDGLTAPIYPTMIHRDLAAAEHAIAVLAESLHGHQSCECLPDIDRVCEACRILDLLMDGLGDAREFLATGPGEGEAA